MSDLAPNPNAIKAGDTSPLVATLQDAKGPVNLATATSVTFRMKSKTPGDGHSPISAPAAVLQSVDPTTSKILKKGVVEYAWQAGQTDAPGTYGIEFMVTWGDGTNRTFPNDRTVTFEIEPKAA